jgi:hypothetical protein
VLFLPLHYCVQWGRCHRIRATFLVISSSKDDGSDKRNRFVEIRSYFTLYEIFKTDSLIPNGPIRSNTL